MSYNGSGTFLINTAGQPVVSGTVISSTAFNALTADLATGLSTAITKDGQTTITANIPMANYKFTGLGTGSAAGDSANLSQVQSTAVKLLASVSGADTITAVGSPNVAAYVAGQMFYFVAAAANTGAVTINIDSLGAKSITRDGTTALAAGDIQSGEVCVIVYDGTQFQLVNGASQSASIVTENLTVNKATVLNESGGDNDTRIEGNGDSHLLFADANENAVGVSTGGNALDDFKFEVVGNKAIGGVRISDTFDANGYEIVTGTTNIITSYNRGTATWLPLRQRANQHEFYCDGVETARLDASGNLGLGRTDQAYRLDVQIDGTGPYIGRFNNASTSTSQYNVVRFTQGASGSAGGYIGTGGSAVGNAAFQNTFVVGTDTANDLVFNTSDAQRARITSGGDFCIGTSSANFCKLSVASSVNGAQISVSGANQTGIQFNSNAGSQGWLVGRSYSGNDANDFFIYDIANNRICQFISTAGETLIAGITDNGAYNLQCNGTGVWGAGAYVNGSDSRIKEDIAPIASGLDVVEKLNPVTYRYKESWSKDQSIQTGFIAQELLTALEGQVYVDGVVQHGGAEDYYSVAYQNIIPILTKAIQELKAELDATKAEVAALKGAN